MSKGTPKNSKTQHNTFVVLVGTSNFLKELRGNGYRFIQKDETFPTITMRLVAKALVCEKLIPQLAPNGTIFLPLHVDAVP